MKKNICISTFINIIFSIVFMAIMITFYFFISFDKQKYEINLKNRYELIAENFLSIFQNYPTKEALIELFDRFQVTPIKDRDKRLEILTSAQELTITQNYLGTYRVYKYNNEYYIYVQQFGYNIMLRDIRNHNYSIAIMLVALFLSLVTLLFLYITLRKKLYPLKILNKQIQDFSTGNKDIDIKIISNDEIGTIAKSFKQAVKTINNQTKSKELFMRNIMHELKTPITKAMFIAETIEDDKTKENLKKAFVRMDTIIKELATVERLTSSKKIIFKEKTSFFNIYTKTLEIMLINPENINTKIRDFNFEVDISMFPLVLKNLIDNAIKFSSDKKAILNSSKEKITISSKGNKLEHDLDYYAEAFNQEEKRNEGFGLGLYIVKTIVKLHNFKLEYYYEDGKNNFVIKLK